MVQSEKIKKGLTIAIIILLVLVTVWFVFFGNERKNNDPEPSSSQTASSEASSHDSSSSPASSNDTSSAVSIDPPPVNEEFTSIPLEQIKSTREKKYPLKEDMAKKIEHYTEINPDSIGHLSISGTNINEMITKTTNNEYYLTYDFRKNLSESGWYYSDFRCDFTPESLTQNFIIYARSMENNGMFSQLFEFKKEEFFQKNKVIEFVTNEYFESRYIVFAVFVTDTKFNYTEPAPASAELQKIIDTAKSKSIYDTKVSANAGDTILTLSTYTYEDPKQDLRFVVMARALRDGEKV